MDHQYFFTKFEKCHKRGSAINTPYKNTQKCQREIQQTRCVHSRRDPRCKIFSKKLMVSKKSVTHTSKSSQIKWHLNKPKYLHTITPKTLVIFCPGVQSLRGLANE